MKTHLRFRKAGERSAKCLLPLLALFAATFSQLATGAQLELTGLQGEMRQNVLAMLGLASETCDAPRWRVKRRFRDAEKEIRAALRALGYYQPGITRQLDWQKTCWQARIEVAPGEPVRVDTLDLVIRGDAGEDPEFERLRAELPVKVGDTLHHGHYESLKQQLRSLASERGYFRAQLTESRLAVDTTRLTAAIDLVFDSGPRFRIAPLQIEEQPYADRLIQRLVKLQEGQAYSADAIQETYRSLADSGYFERVEVTPETDRLGDDTLPVRITLVARKRHAYQFGAGLSSDLGVTLSAEYDNRRINRLGHQFGAKLSLSTVRSEGTLDYRVPLYESRWRRLNLQGGFAFEDTDETRSDTVTLGARLSGKRGAWNETAMLDLQHETSFVEGREFDSLLLIPGLRWDRRRVDDLIRPRSGRYLELELRGAAEGIVSDTSFLRAKARAKWLRPLGSGTGIARIELGTIQTTDFDNIPTSLRFFAGGDQSVRGYEYESLAPSDADGDLAGGANLVVASLEYEHPVAQDWGVAVFADAGNAFDSVQEELKTGVGVGVRWYTPVGPVKVDLGFPRDDADDTFRIHFSFGTGL